LLPWLGAPESAASVSHVKGGLFIRQALPGMDLRSKAYAVSGKRVERRLKRTSMVLVEVGSYLEYAVPCAHLSTGNDRPESSERFAEEDLGCIAERVSLKLDVTTTSPQHAQCGTCVTGVAYFADTKFRRVTSCTSMSYRCNDGSWTIDWSSCLEHKLVGL